MCKILLFLLLFTAQTYAIENKTINIECSSNLDTNTIQPGIWLFSIKNIAAYGKFQDYLIKKMKKYDRNTIYNSDAFPKISKELEKYDAIIFVNKPSDQLLLRQKLIVI